MKLVLHGDENMKGQVSFESLILLVFIITVTAYIGSLYLQTHDTTLATAIIRSELSAQINSLDGDFIISQIEFTKNTSPTFDINTIPNTLDDTNFDLTTVETLVNNATKFSGTVININ